VISAASSQTPPHFGERGSPLDRRKPSTRTRKRTRMIAEGRRRVVTGASEDASSVDVAGRTTPASKRSKDRHIRSAWGVVKRAMHLQDSARLARETSSRQRLWITERVVGARSRSVVGRKPVARISGR